MPPNQLLLRRMAMQVYPGPTDPSIYTVAHGNSLAMDMEAAGVSHSTKTAGAEDAPAVSQVLQRS